ncbi:hypothetical protein SAY86_002634 [Trapa natans]|uniref:TIR domain-containing protein n=1 Tax=Trapa natans TaxID=22666 RepID=A0AAN7R2N3_TRANT|nr:hypothetical protein SAY86_002634 [Trapa natans]
MEADLEAPRADYEVFLSFRGPDTRQGFADVLYDYMTSAGIRVFRDDDELAIGDKIDTILRAIENSLICVPIFSKTFAASKWCLTEVRRMVDLDKDVVPIFYDVTPDDVDLKTAVYRDFVAEKERLHGTEMAEGWKSALKTVTKLKGRELLKSSYSNFCKTFVNEVLIKLKPRKGFDLDTVVGIKTRLDTALSLLDIAAGGVKYVLIHGMGGIGKTTLGKAIFNKISSSFDACCFLENFQESLKRDGLNYLLKQLGDSLDPKSALTFHSSRDTGERIYGKKVLIILDDVNTGEHMGKLIGKFWFASGSRVIITSRNINVLDECKCLDEGSVESLEMNTLEDDEAVQLFSLCAPHKDIPPDVFERLCKEAVSITGGLPFALKDIAKSVRGKDEAIWRHVMARSKNVIPKEVKNMLKMSYDLLEIEQKQIFLDIACFFIGMEKTNPCYMWETHDLDPTYGLEVLVSMSLVKIKDNSVIWMHELLRDLGRDIVRQESINNPMKRSRIWHQDDAVKILVGKEGKEAVEALSLRTPLVNTLTDQQLSSFQNLRFLELAGANFEGESNGLLENLTWLSCHWCPADFSLSKFCLENLVVLDLSHSLMDENWGGWSHIQVAKNLKVLELRCCQNLACTPEFTDVHTLERLILSGCTRLAAVHGSIGNLRSLKFLDLRCCSSLRGLPEELGLLKDLSLLH